MRHGIAICLACAWTVFGVIPTVQAGSNVGEGMLHAFGPDGQELGPCPLKHTDVDIEVSGYVARVEVTQQFHNPYDYKIEAIYVFPLSQDAAVDDMTMTVGERVIRGQIKPREEARQIYEAAKQAGHVASLLDQERPNIFTQSVANIEPGEQVTITIRYVEDLEWKDGIYSFDFPMVVGPRYIPGAPKVTPADPPEGEQILPGPILLQAPIHGVRLFSGMNLEDAGTLHEGQAKALLMGAKPAKLPDQWNKGPWYSFEATYAGGKTELGTFFLGGLGEIGGRHFFYDLASVEGMGTGWSPDTDQVPDASKITPPVTPEGTRAGHDISITMNINAGLPIQSIESKQHEVSVSYLDDAKNTAVVELVDQAAIPNKDFVVTFTTASADIGDALVTHTDERGNFFTLILQPPKRIPPEWIVPKEMIFVIDKSGSMRGFPIDTAKQAMRLVIQNLNPADTFNLMTFAGGLGFCFDKSMPNTAANRRQALDYLTDLKGSGGTEMMKAINACLGGDQDPERVRIVCFMTDGYVGNDMAILGAVRENADETRVFSFGIGRSVNRYLMDGLAAAGRGEVDYVLDESQCDGAAQRFYDRVSTPVLVDIEIDWGELEVEELFPSRIPDLFAAKPVVIKGRYLSPGKGTITLRGQRGTEEFERTIEIEFPEQDEDDEVVASLWARAKIKGLMNQDLTGIQVGDPDADIKEQIVELGLTYRLLTQFTSFVAVEEMFITRGGKSRKVAVPVEMPEGVSYEGVFGIAAETSAPNFDRTGAIFGGDAMRGMPKAKSAHRIKASLTPARAGGVGGVQQARLDFDQASAREASPIQLLDAIKKDTTLTPGQKRERTLEIKLAKELHGLAERVGDDGKLADGAIHVEDGKVEVTVYLADTSDETMKMLKELGLEVLVQTRAIRMVIGLIDVSKLEELALLDPVRRVALPDYSPNP